MCGKVKHHHQRQRVEKQRQTNKPTIKQTEVALQLLSIFVDDFFIDVKDSVIMRWYLSAYPRFLACYFCEEARDRLFSFWDFLEERDFHGISVFNAVCSTQVFVRYDFDKIL